MAYGLPQLQTPNIVGGYQQGVQYKQQQKRQPILEAMDAAKLKATEQSLERGRKAMTLEDLSIQEQQNKAKMQEQEDLAKALQWADTPEKWQQAQQFYAQEGKDYSNIPFEKRDMLMARFTPESTLPVATPRATEGDFAFKDEETGNIFYTTKYTNPNTQETVVKLTDATGKPVQPKQGTRLAPVNKLGQTVGEAIDYEGLKEFTKKQSTEAVKSAEDYATKIESIDRRSELFDRGINLLTEEGAETGAVANLFPSFRQSTQELDQLQSEMGLEVVRATTFGSLSKGELDVAKQVAFPKELDEKSLAEWMRTRKSAEQKLKEGYQRYMQLSNMGYTKPEIMDLTKTKGYRPRRNKNTGEVKWVNDQGEILSSKFKY